jgi:hypothetical protein
MDKRNALEELLSKFFPTQPSEILMNEIESIFLPQEEYFTKREVDFIYCIGVLNTSGMDGLHKELQRLKEIGKEPSDIITSLRTQK